MNGTVRHVTKVLWLYFLVQETDEKEPGLVLIGYVCIAEHVSNKRHVSTEEREREREREKEKETERESYSCRGCSVMFLGGRQTSSATTLLGLLTVV
jgi:hypothetical protein